MIPNFLISGNKNKGSSLMLPANGLGGSRATILFLFSFLKAAAAPALRALKQAGKKEGGWGGRNFCPLVLSAPKARLGRKRWAKFNPQNPLDFAQKKFGF